MAVDVKTIVKCDGLVNAKPCENNLDMGSITQCGAIVKASGDGWKFAKTAPRTHLVLCPDCLKAGVTFKDIRPAKPKKERAKKEKKAKAEVAEDKAEVVAEAPKKEKKAKGKKAKKVSDEEAKAIAESEF